MDIKPLPFRASLEQYEKQAQELLDAFRSGDREAIRFIKQYHPHLRELPESEVQQAGLALDDARRIMARDYEFDRWADLAAYVEAVGHEDSPVAHFESAVEAIIAGEGPNRYNPEGNHSHSVPLHQSRHEGVVRLLVERGAELNILDTLWQGTPLDWAIYGGRTEMEKYLREQGAKTAKEAGP